MAQALIRAFARHYGVDMAEAAHPSLADYRSFNSFFTRALNADARPLPDNPDTVISPADGYLSQFGRIERDRIVPAKGRDFTVSALLADAALAATLEGGTFCTVYLSPRDYHRVHAPATGELLRTIEVPGRLFSVNDRTAAVVPGLFARNERLVCVFDTFVLVLVGALIVASIETVWNGPHSPYAALRARDATGHFPPGRRGRTFPGRFDGRRTLPGGRVRAAGRPGDRDARADGSTARVASCGVRRCPR